MTTVASLRVALEADASKFKRAMADSAASVKKFAIGAAAAGVAAGAFIKAGLDSADEIDKLSQRTGLSVQAVSALRFAASQAGTDINTFQRGINNLARAIGEATLGGKRQAEAFELLGIDIRKLKRLKPERQFALVADKLNSMADQTVAAAVGQVLFGGAFRKLQPLLKTGSEGMQQAADRAAKLGLELDGAAVNAGVKATDSLDALSRSVGALRDVVVLSFAEDIATATDTMAENMINLVAVIDASKVAFDGFVAAQKAIFTGDIPGFFNAITETPGNVIDAFQARVNSQARSAVDFTGTRSGSDESAQAAEETAKNTSEQIVVLRRMANGIERISVTPVAG